MKAEGCPPVFLTQREYKTTEIVVTREHVLLHKKFSIPDMMRISDAVYALYMGW